MAFGIMIGIARMMDDNATVIALNNSTTAASYSKAFQTFEVIGCFTTGVFLSLYRLYVSPYALFAFYAFMFTASQVLMFFISVSSMA